MTRIEHRPENGYFLHDFPAPERQRVPRIESTSRVVWKTGEYLNTMPPPDELLCKRQALKAGLGIEEL